MSERRTVGALALAWAGVIFVASSIPARQMPQVGFLVHDKLVHVGAYAPLGALSLLALRTTSVRFPAWLLVVLGGVIAGAYGVTDEFHQRFVPGRSVEALDVTADFIGGCLGSVAAFVLTRLRAARPSARGVAPGG